MDISLLFPQGSISADILIDAPGLKTGDDLESAIIISIFTDRRANDDDKLLPNEDPRGWFGDTFSPYRNDKIGSRLWLLRRGKMLPETLVKAREYVLEALRWLVDDNIVSSVNVTTERYNMNTLAILVEVIKPQGSDTFNFQHVWDTL